MRHEIPDLNEQRIESADGPNWPLEDPATHAVVRAEIVFRDIEKHLIRFLRGAQVVVGCAAWLTNSRILEALAQTQGVGIIVQKEDFLRPDVGAAGGWKRSLHRLYQALPYLPSRYLLPGLLGSLSVCCDGTFEPVRCVGYHNRDRKLAFPRMHHKFFVRCSLCDRSDDWSVIEDPIFTPEAVWTGSFNPTENGTHSLENAAIFWDASFAQAYFTEFSQVAALSERLDWETDWCEPQWRIGT